MYQRFQSLARFTFVFNSFWVQNENPMNAVTEDFDIWGSTSRAACLISDD